MSADTMLKTISDESVEYVDIRFTDPRGKLQHVTVMADQVDADFIEEGFMFDGSSIAGWKSIEASDMKLMIDTDSAYVDPFYAEKTLCVHCSVVEPDTGEAYERDPRGTAEKAEAYLKMFCKNYFHFGDVGMGAKSKLLNNFLTLGNAALINHMAKTANQLGLDMKKLFEVAKLGSGNSAALNRVFDNLLKGDFFIDDLHKRLYATDASVYRILPLAIICPKVADDIITAIKFVTKHNISLIPRTAGTSLAGQCVGEGIILDFSKSIKIDCPPYPSIPITVSLMPG